MYHQKLFDSGRKFIDEAEINWNENQVEQGIHKIILFSDSLLITKPKKISRPFQGSKTIYCVKNEVPLTALMLGCASPIDGNFKNKNYFKKHVFHSFFYFLAKEQIIDILIPMDGKAINLVFNNHEKMEKFYENLGKFVNKIEIIEVHDVVDNNTEENNQNQEESSEKSEKSEENKQDDENVEREEEEVDFNNMQIPDYPAPEAPSEIPDIEFPDEQAPEPPSDPIPPNNDNEGTESPEQTMSNENTESTTASTDNNKEKEKEKEKEKTIKKNKLRKQTSKAKTPTMERKPIQEGKPKPMARTKTKTKSTSTLNSNETTKVKTKKSPLTQRRTTTENNDEKQKFPPSLPGGSGANKYGTIGFSSTPEIPSALIKGRSKTISRAGDDEHQQSQSKPLRPHRPSVVDNMTSSSDDVNSPVVLSKKVLKKKYSTTTGRNRRPSDVSLSAPQIFRPNDFVTDGLYDEVSRGTEFGSRIKFRNPNIALDILPTTIVRIRPMFDDHI